MCQRDYTYQSFLSIRQVHADLYSRTDAEGLPFLLFYPCTSHYESSSRKVVTVGKLNLLYETKTGIQSG